ncbi:hypothetical protein BYZ73_09640 [Rhodovulum viride]|uniref:Uncharacterized protein n=1 Tax=Rhodovulum viride TaxID=1231134 RepID=A0ABX9DHA8_9RHOB|nr:hypothetical protein [Rhodovulum viride]RAP41518.1 hypothetical protein BYZ73_09640 [Rhodovulum viride]
MRGHRDTGFLYRALVLCVVALTVGLGAVVVATNHELEKVVAPSLYRNLLLFLGPLVAICLTGFSLFSRSFSRRSFLSELLILLASYCVFLSVYLPHVLTFRGEAGKTCHFWQFGCADVAPEPDHRLTITGLVLAAAIYLIVFLREGIFRVRNDN